MADSLRCFWNGWKRAAQLWPMVLLLYLVDTALALILAVPPAMQLDRVFGHSAMAPELAGPITLNLLIETSGGLVGIPLPWPLYLLVPALWVLVGTFLRGGTLGAMVGRPETFRWREFFSDCARFFGRFLLLLLFLIPGLLAVLLLFLVISLLFGFVSLGAVGDTLTRFALLGSLLYLLLLALDYARISLVLEPERSTWRHLGRGLRFLIRRFPRVALLGLAFALVAALIAVAYPALLQLSPFFGAFLPSLVAQQTLALLASWQRVAMLGAEADLYQGIEDRG